MEGVGELTHNRRSFLRNLGKTLAVGVGFGLLTNANASGTTNVCGITCSVVSCGCGGAVCGDVGPCFGNCFYCVSGPCGYSYYECSAHPCTGFCACDNCC